MSTEIEKLHRTYCDLTRLDVQCTMFRLLAWEAFISRQFTVQDLALVCKSLRRLVDQGKRTMGCLSFHRLVTDLEIFEEHLAEFRSLERKPRFWPGKAAVLKATGRPAEPEPPSAHPAKTAIERLKLAEQLRQFKKNL